MRHAAVLLALFLLFAMVMGKKNKKGRRELDNEGPSTSSNSQNGLEIILVQLS